MNREDRKKRLEYLIQERKKNEGKLKREQQTMELLGLFPEKEDVEILDESESDRVESNMTECFPFAFWGRIDWEKVRNKIILTTNDVYFIPSLISNQSFDTSSPVYLIAGDYKYPVVKTSLLTFMENVEDVMYMGPDQWIYSPTFRYVVEISHDNEITIGWI